MTDIWRLSVGLAAALVVATPLRAQGLKDAPVWQPTGPCEVVKCDPQPDTSVRAEARLTALPIRSEDRAGEIARRCQDAVTRFRPERGGPVVYSALDAYISACFHKVEALQAPKREFLEGSIFRLQVEGSLCTGILLADGTAVTARHCFARHGEAIPSSRLDSAELRWVSSSGKVRAEKGVRLVRDPVATPGEQGSTDYIIIATRSPLDVPSSTRARLATRAEAIGLLRNRLRMELPSFVGDSELVIDDFQWCIVLHVDEKRNSFKHHCQALHGSSGAPLLVWRESGPPLVVGIHAGASGELSQDGLFPGSNEATITR